jgi:hypothetical protein
MSQPSLIEEFISNTRNELLRKLLEAYRETINLSENRQVSRLIQQMKTELQERRNADSRS